MRKSDKSRHRKRLAKNSCVGKIRYASGFAAKNAARAVSSKKGETLNAYYCKHCKFWHLGHRYVRVL